MYLWLKWLHVVSVISWMAGILYLYRLLIYLAERGSNGEIKDLLVLMARRLFKYITVPAAVVSYVAGLGMVAVMPEIAKGHWFGAKFILVLALTHFTVKAGLLVGRFEKGAANLPTSKKLRWLNEAPTVLMLVIVYLVLFKPF
ncbi:MAG: TIGR00701 family protein [Deltaproteobacteria bacterium]|nr:TIGR00701 family protein [Deltaproteobacteria bacterium]